MTKTYVGQHGKTYTNDNGKGDVVAFISDSTKLVGNMSTDGKTFTTTVGEVEYTSTTAIDLATITTDEFFNGAKKAITSTTASTEYTLNVDLSGKKIAKVYSVMDWTPSTTDKIDAAGLKDITADKSLLGYKFTKDDDKNIDMNSFALVGVSSLDKIAADNVVYVYAANNEITKIEVGTEVATGTVQNFKKKGADAANFNIGTKSYKNASEVVNGGNGDTIDADKVGDDVKAFLDANGYVYKFDASNGGAKNLAVISRAGGSFNDEVKIFTSEGKTETHLYDKAELHVGNTVASAGAVIGYGLNKDGKITSSNENSDSATTVNFKSNSVVKVGSTDKVIASDVVVFVQKSNGDYALSTVDKIDKNKNVTVTSGAVLYKDSKKDKVIAVLVPEANAKASTDDVYAVVTAYYTEPTDGDKVSRIIGFADGKAIDKKADSVIGSLKNANTAPSFTSNSGVTSTVELFKIDMDAAGIITGANKVVAATGETTITAVAATGADDRNSITIATGEKLTLAKDVIVYEVNDKNEYVVYHGNFKANDLVVLYDLNDDKGHDGAEVVFLDRSHR